MSDFGTDVGTYPDLDPSFSTIAGNRVLCEAIAKRLSTPRGLLGYAPNYGTDIRALLNSGLTQTTLSALRAQIVAEVLKEERVHSCVASCTLDSQAQTLRVVLTIVADTGPFTLVLGVAALSLSILS